MRVLIQATSRLWKRAPCIVTSRTVLSCCSVPPLLMRPLTGECTSSARNCHYLPGPRDSSFLSSTKPSPRHLSRLLHTTGCYLSATSQMGKILSTEQARLIVAELGAKEREWLQSALHELTTDEHDITPDGPPSTKQLRLVCIEAALPFIGFGFLDNAIMIVAGEWIDMTIGTALGISTMAAAALGNLISDLSGLGLADSVEAICRSLGMPNPKLTLSQSKTSSVRWMRRIGRCIGVTIGCIVGMLPLFWFNKNPPSTDKESNKVVDHE